MGLALELLEVHLVVEAVGQDLRLLADHHFLIELGLWWCSLLRPPSKSVLQIFLLFQFYIRIGEELFEIRIYEGRRHFVEAEPPRRLIRMVAAVVPLQLPGQAFHHQGAIGAELMRVSAFCEHQLAFEALEAVAPENACLLIRVACLLIHLNCGNSLKIIETQGLFF